MNKTLENHINSFNRQEPVIGMISKDKSALFNIPCMGMTSDGFLAYKDERKGQLMDGTETFGFTPELTESKKFERLQGILKGEGKGLWTYQNRLDAAAEEITQLSRGLNDKELFYLDGLTSHVTELMSRNLQRRKPEAKLSTEKLDTAMQAQYAPVQEGPAVFRMIRDNPAVVKTALAFTTAAFAGGIAIGAAGQVLKNYNIHNLGDLVTKIGNIPVGSPSMLYADEPQQNEEAKAFWDKMKKKKEGAQAAAKTEKKPYVKQQSNQEKKETVTKDDKPVGFLGGLVNKINDMFSGGSRQQDNKAKADVRADKSRLLYYQNAPQFMNSALIPLLNIVIYTPDNYVKKTFNQMKEGSSFSIQYGDSFGLDKKIVYKDKDGKERTLDCLIQKIDAEGNRSWYLTNKNWEPNTGVGRRAFDLDRINTKEADITPGKYAVVFTNEGRIRIMKAEDAKKNPIYQSTLIYMTVEGEPGNKAKPADQKRYHSHQASDKPGAQQPATPSKTADDHQKKHKDKPAKAPKAPRTPAEPVTDKDFQLIGGAWYMQGDETFTLAKKEDPQNSFRSSMIEGIIRTKNFQAWINNFGISYDLEILGFDRTTIAKKYNQFQIGGQLRLGPLLGELVYMNGSNTWESNPNNGRFTAMTGIEESSYNGFFYRGGLFIPLTSGGHGFLSKGFVTATIGAGSGNTKTTYSDNWMQDVTTESQTIRDTWPWHAMALSDLGFLGKPLDGIVAEVGAGGSNYHSTDGEITGGERFNIGAKLMIPASKILPSKIMPSWLKDVSIVPIVMYTEKNDSRFKEKHSNTTYGIGITLKTR
ncbi:MAG: hypothetical protein V1866_03430 [archaeon]